MKLLLDVGVIINALCEARGTPLFYAAFNGKNETLEYLLDHGADANIKKPSTKGNGEPVSVFDIARTKGHKSILAILTAHIQSQGIPRKRLNFSTESSQLDQPTTITGAHPTQGSENEVTTSSLSTAPELAHGPIFKYPSPPPLVRPTQPSSVPCVLRINVSASFRDISEQA